MISRALWILSILAVIGQSLWVYPSMPDRFASHFNGAGQPDAWMDRGAFFVVWFVCVGLANVAPVLTGWIMRHTPPSMINLPNKDYWLADDDRRERAIGVVGASVHWALIPINGVLLMALHGVWKHAHGGPFVFPLPIFLACLALAVFLPIILLYGGLRVPKTDGQGSWR